MENMLTQSPNSDATIPLMPASRAITSIQWKHSMTTQLFWRGREGGKKCYNVITGKTRPSREIHTRGLGIDINKPLWQAKTKTDIPRCSWLIWWLSVSRRGLTGVLLWSIQPLAAAAVHRLMKALGGREGTSTQNIELERGGNSPLLRELFSQWPARHSHAALAALWHTPKQTGQTHKKANSVPWNRPADNQSRTTRATKENYIKYDSK